MSMLHVSSRPNAYKGQSIARRWAVSTDEGLQGIPVCVSFSHDDTKMAVGFWEPMIEIRDVGSQKIIHTLTGHTQIITRCLFTYDDQFVISASRDHTVKIWNAESGECIKTLKGHKHEVIGLSLSFNGNILMTSSMDNTIRMWSIKTGECIRILLSENYFLSGLCCLLDNNSVVVCPQDYKYKELKLLNLKTARYVKTFKGHTDQIRNYSVSHNKKMIVSISNNHIKLWDVDTEKCIRTINEFGSEFTSCEFTHDDSMVVVCSRDCRIKFWDVKTGKCIETLGIDDTTSNKFTLSHNNRLMAVIPYQRDDTFTRPNPKVMLLNTE